MIKWKKYICIALSATMMASLMTGCGDTSDSSSDKKETTTKESDADVLQEAITSQISADDADDADKEETVFVVADANGENEDVTVSTWLKNADGADGLNDYTTLTDIENVKGYETYQTNDDGTITWQANGNDIYYQGKSTEQLPVDVKLTYMLDGEEIESEELAGKSGKVTIRFDYTNNTKQTVKAGSRNVEVVSPFVMLSGMILPVDKFSNVQVTNGKVISEGSNQIVVGYAVPGFKDCLESGINDSKIEEAIDDIEVPEYVEVTADVTDFELAMTMTVAASDLLGDDADEAIEEAKTGVDLDSLTNDVDTLADSADQLEEGAGTLTDGLKTLKEGTYSLKSGSQSLADGADSLQSYISQLADGSAKITSAMSTLDNGIQSVKSGASALNDGASELASGAKSVDSGVSDVLSGESDLDDGMGQLVAGYEGEKGAVAGAKSLASGTKTLYESSTALADGAKSVQDGVNTLVTTLTETPSAVTAGASQSVYEKLSAYGITDENALDAAMTKLAAVLAAGPEDIGAEAYNQCLTQYTALAQAKGALSAVDQVGTSLDAAINSDDNKAKIKALTDGTQSLSDGAVAMSGGLKSAADGAAALSDGIGKLYSGTKSASEGVDKLITGTNTLKKGTASLSSGASTVSTSLGTLYKGSVSLADGSSQLYSAAGTLSSSADQIADGAKTLSSGAAELNTGVGTLDSGAEELVTGSTTLSDGMKKFNKEGIKKITDMFSGSYQTDIDFIEALFSDDAVYTTYGGALDGTSSTVKFIYETGAIKAEDAE